MIKLLIPTLLILTAFSCAPHRIEQGVLDVSEGRLERHKAFSSEFVAPRHVDVWLPEDYSSRKKYSVLYMHDGQMLFDSATTWNHQEWGVDEVINRLVVQGKIRNTLVVAIWNTELRHSEYFPQKPFENLPSELQDSLINLSQRNPETALFKSKIKSDDYLKFVTRELKPFIDQKYSTFTDRENTFVMGSSMGGLISIYALCEYPEVFGGAGCLSTHWIGTFDTLNNPIPETFKDYLKDNLPDPGNHKIYFDFGTETLDAFYEPYQGAVDGIMKLRGYSPGDWQTLKFEGEDHSEESWNKRLHIPLKFLLGQGN